MTALNQFLWKSACTSFLSSEMLRTKHWVALIVFAAITGTAWIPAEQSVQLGLAASLLAVIAFSLELSGGANMGFVFVIASLGRLSWIDTLLLANAAQFIVLGIRRERPDPVAQLRSAAAISLAIVGSHAVFHFADVPQINVPFDVLLGSTACFAGVNVFQLRLFQQRREILWSYPYYLVAAGIAAMFPIGFVPVLVFLAWWSYRTYERRLDRYHKKTSRAAELHMRTIETLALAIETRDRPLNGRSRRVQVYTAAIARILELDPNEREALRVASLLYDIGELAIPEHIILKSGRLTPEEFDKVKIHTEIGAEILERVNFPYPVTPIVRAHHERWDGSGYPRGMSRDDIPLGARILAAVDALDAMASPRHHRAALPLDLAVERIRSEGGRAFDPQIVALIERHYREWERLVEEDPQGGFTVPILSAQREAQVIFDLTARLGISLDLEETFEAVKSALRQLAPFETVAVWIEKDGSLCVEKALGDHRAFASSLRLPLGAGISGQAAAGARSSLLSDSADEFAAAGVAPEMCPFRYLISAPLASGSVRGALTLYRAGDQPFTLEHARILDVIAPKLAAAISNGLRFRSVKHQAGADSLTGLPNAGALAAKMASLDAPCAVVVCDLDGFKRVNDEFGHLVGNRILESVAEGFRASCRDQDFVARMGGDEFVLLLCNVQPAALTQRLDQFREMVRAVGTRVTGVRGLDASFGAAFYPAEGRSPDELLVKADQRMYQRKGGHELGFAPGE